MKERWDISQVLFFVAPIFMFNSSANADSQKNISMVGKRCRERQGAADTFD
jgi:hypothetical protein